MFALRFREYLMSLPGVTEEFEGLYKRLNATFQDLSSLPVGAVVAYVGDEVPQGWLRCDGRAVDRARYRQLFKAIGTRHGAGNNTTTFHVPDLRTADGLPYLILAGR